MSSLRRAWRLTGMAALAVALLLAPVAPAGQATEPRVPSIPPAIGSLREIVRHQPVVRPIGRVVRSQVLVAGVVLEAIRVASPPQQIAVVRVAPGAQVRASLVAAGPAVAPFATVSSAVRRSHALVGINGYFRGMPAQSPMLIRDGRIVALTRGALPTERHPRTAVGIDGEGGVLLVTVDGRRSDAIGMTYRELAMLMRSLGTTWAVNLDGGASTAMVAAGHVMNRPSDPFGERVVPTVVAITMARGVGRMPLLRQLMELDPRIVMSSSGRTADHGRAI